MTESAYKIENYECSSKEEYDAIKIDLATIYKIRKTLDENNINDLKKILNFVAKNDEVLNSKLGELYKKTIIKKYKSYKAEKNDIIDNSFSERTIAEKGEHSDKEIDKSQTIEPMDSNIKDSNSSEIIRYDVSNGKKYLRLSIDIKMPKEKNFLYLFCVFAITCLGSFLVLINRTNNIFTDSMNSDISDSLIIVVIWICIILIITIAIGISEYVRIQNVYKAISEAEERLFNDKKDEENGIAWIFVILMIVGIFIPPILIILMIVGAIYKAVPKFRWLKMNGKAFVAYILFTWSFSIVAWGMINVFDLLSKNRIGESKTNLIVISICVGIISVGFIYLIAKFQNKPVFYAFRAMCAVPIMIFMALMPFVGIAAYAYIIYGSKSSNSGGYTAPGVHTVAGHERHLKNGNVIWINPYPKTNPDGILWNNYSYKR